MEARLSVSSGIFEVLPDTSLKEFCASAMSPSRLRSFLFCEAQPMVQRQRQRSCRIDTARRGIVQHEVDLSWQVERLGDLEPVDVYTVGEALGYLADTIRVALRRRVVLANTFSVRTFASIVRELVPWRGLLGYPDAVDCRDGSPVIIEKKWTLPPPMGVWPGHRIQVMGYLAGLEELGWPEPRGKVMYRGKVADVAYGNAESSWLRRVARRLDEVESGAEPYPSYRCSDCLWSEVCPWGM